MATIPARERSRDRTGGISPFIALDPRAKMPLHEQIYAAVRDQILAGKLSPGAQLASSREMAKDLGVSRFTIVTAFSTLLAEGYVGTTLRGATFVSRNLPDLKPRVARSAARKPSAPERKGEALLSSRGAAIAATTITGPRDGIDGPRPFHPRRPPLDLFPVSLWQRCVRSAWRGGRGGLLDYGDPAGLPALRSAIAEHARSTRGVECTPEQVIITSGAQQAFNLIAELLLDPGDAVWIEEPGYLDARAAFAAAGARIVPVPVDGEGLQVSAGMQMAPDATLAYISPSHQYPTGATLSAARRLELIDWAHANKAWIVEDDYDSYFRYRGRPLPAVQRMEVDRFGSTARVIYVGTFSKSMFPSLRLGFCVVPPELIDAFANARAVADRNSSQVDQAALELFMRDGHYDRHLRRTRNACIERHDAILASVRRRLKHTVEVEPMNAGTHLVCWLSRGSPPGARIASAAKEAGLILFPLGRYTINKPARDAIILGYGAVPAKSVDGHIRELAAIIAGLR